MAKRPHCHPETQGGLCLVRLECLGHLAIGIAGPVPLLPVWHGPEDAHGGIATLVLVLLVG